MYIGKLYNVSPLHRISRSRKLESQALAACSILLYCHAFLFWQYLKYLFQKALWGKEYHSHH